MFKNKISVVTEVKWFNKQKKHWLISMFLFVILDYAYAIISGTLDWNVFQESVVTTDHGFYQLPVTVNPEQLNITTWSRLRSLVKTLFTLHHWWQNWKWNMGIINRLYLVVWLPIYPWELNRGGGTYLEKGYGNVQWERPLFPLPQLLHKTSSTFFSSTRLPF